MKNSILIVFILLLGYSCKKENNSNSSGGNSSSYLPMSIGNYWVYQEFDIDANGNVNQTDIFDSTIISKDTVIKNQLYYKFDRYQYFYISNKTQTNYLGFVYYRDSSKYLVNSVGKIFFSENNFNDTILRETQLDFSDTIFWITCKMAKVNSNVVVPAGVFNNLLGLHCTVITNLRNTAIKNPRYVDIFYAREVGEILHSHIFSSIPASFEDRLVRYKIIK